MRPHYHDSAISRPICEVKHGQVWLVLAGGGPAGKSRCCIFFSRFFYRGFQSHSTNSRKKVSTDKVHDIALHHCFFKLVRCSVLPSWANISTCPLRRFAFFYLPTYGHVPSVGFDSHLARAIIVRRHCAFYLPTASLRLLLLTRLRPLPFAFCRVRFPDGGAFCYRRRPSLRPPKAQM